MYVIISTIVKTKQKNNNFYYVGTIEQEDYCAKGKTTDRNKERYNEKNRKPFLPPKIANKSD